MLKIEQISKTFNPGTITEKVALQDVSLHLREGDFIADVGIGGPAPIEPLLFEYFREQEREGVLWRIVPDNVLGSVIQQQQHGEWLNFYSFDDAPQQNLDFTYAHYYYTHCPLSPFLNKTIVHIRTPHGRNSIYTELDSDTGLPQPLLTIGNPDGTTSSRYLYRQEQFDEALRLYFGLVR